MQPKDFVKIKYTGKIKESGQAFDSGDNLCVIIGAGQVLKGLDTALTEMKVGDKKTIIIQPDQGFGSRKPDLIKVVPISEFRKHNTKPHPGLIVNADNKQGRVLSVNSGRVKVDFNHPLAGRVLEYELEVKEQVKDNSDKVKGLVEFYTKIKPDQVSVTFNDKHIEVIAPPLIHPVMKKKIADDIRKYIKEILVKFSELFEVPKKKETNTEKTK